jgi:hypothetical protein
MDPFDLSLNPAISGDLFFNNNYSDEIEDNDFLNFGKNNLDENFSLNFDKVFNPITPDNKEDSFSEIDNSLNANNIDDFILLFQKKLNIYYFNKDFDGIINTIEKKFPYFFNEKNYGLLYIIQKLRFFELLREENVNDAKTFYQEKLLILLKEVKKQNWETKNKFFNKLMKKPSLVLKQGDLQKKYYDNFTYELDKSIRNFLAVDENNENQSKNDYFSSNNINFSSSLDFDNLKINFNSKKFHKSKEIINDKETNDDEKDGENSDEKNEELDIENWSTQEEFSDFEDEIQQKCSENLENKKLEENDGNHINTNPLLTENEILGVINDPVGNNNPLMRDLSLSSSFSKSHKNSDDIFNNFPQEDDNIENDFIIDTSSKNNQNIINEKNNYNNNIYNNQNLNSDNNREISTKTKSSKSKINKKSQKSSNKKVKNKNEEIIFNQLPFLNSFKPKYIKRETIDKKIIRTFKNYVVKEYKEHRLELNNVTMDQDFFINFVNGNLLPPIDFYDATTGEYIKFNSFNCSYLLWFFSKKGVKEIYGNFINEKGKDFINSLSDYYEISPEEKSQLNNYIFNFPFIFDISLVNNITQGMKVTHMYRTVDKNKIQNENRRKKKEEERNLDLKRIKSDSIDGGRERSRSRDFDEDDK